MQIVHAGTKKLVEVKPGDIVRARGITKSAEIGRVVAVEPVRSLGLPYAKHVVEGGKIVGVKCPTCGEVIEQRERKDFESFTGAEYAAHHETEHAAQEEQLIVFWFGVGTGSGWKSTDVEVVQTADERAGLISIGTARFLQQVSATKTKPRASGEGLNGAEQYQVREIARELRVRYIELHRAVLQALGGRS